MLGFRGAMCSRQHTQACLNTSLSIRQEIQRFESVHPSIYALYDLVELVPDPLLAQQIRDHVVAIEDSFVNSQEWTASRGVTELRVGVLGSPDSGKSALVHRYLTGTYMQEESPEGGRFKKEVIIDGHSYLLLIRDEGGSPEMQFTAWVDAVIFVFSLDNEISYNTVSNYFNKMSHYRNSAEIPIILVGTQDAISESSPRVVDDNRARKLSTELRRCSYYETCATYGLNVERVFQDACQKIVGTRLSSSSQCLSGGSRPVTPQPLVNSPSHNHSTFLYKDSLPRGHHTLSASSHHLHRGAQSFDASSNSSGISSTHVVEIHSTNGSDTSSRWGNSLGSHGSSSGLVSIATENNNVKFTAPHCLDNLQPVKDAKDLPTPSSTPTTSRKTRRRSNLFTPSKKGDDRLKNGELGSGRAIPLKQGYLYKKSSKALNKEWKKKYVTLCDDGRLTYHPSLHDYMEDVNGKEISLQYVTVKVPGQKPRGSKSIITTVPGYNGYSSLDIHDSIGGLSLGYKEKPTRATDKALMSAFDTMKEPASSRQSLASEVEVGSTNGADKDTPHVKKRHRRMKSSGLKKDGEDDGDGATSCEFTIVSLDGKRWRWEVGATGCAAAAERDAWVAAVEAQILASLQGRTSRLPAPTGANSTGDVRATYYIRRVKGNDKCCDCGAADPDWASLNLGVLMCIECSGVHRNLGSHISRVRSLDLDEWPLSHVSVMVSLGNALANSIWEADLRGHIKPIANSSREEKERWIRLKYERRAFLSATEVPTGLEALKAASSRGAVSTLARMLAVPPPRAPAPAERALALRAAAAAGHLASAQLLIWHNGNPNYPDADGHACVFYARAAANHLSGIPTQYPKNLQLTCPLHPNPPSHNGSGTNSTSSSSSTKSSIKNPDPDCNCIIFELLNAQSAANALVELLIGLQNNQYMNGGFETNGGGISSSFSHGTLGRPSIGPNLSLTNGKCGSIV
ncbi:centaurin-gamma-1A isoform X1 [Hyposmocoma kahamanoa]|uniref:centaurin-gamma-1A isoform X1 n=2 Tax=Hyposmocoma kahamanoa TaxID=1477025 RepID=UPI000E6D91A1|nr:centaurin-gamma-1A isoform X1 [Hyposmocoma kahamanoa]